MASSTSPATAALGAVTLHCSACGWSFHAAAGAAAGRCPHCWRADLSAGSAVAAPPSEKLVPFTVSPARIDEAIAAFARDIPSPSRDLDPATLRKRMRAMHLPVYLVDADVKATWQAQAGFDYAVVSHQELGTDAGWQTQEVTESRLRWEPRLGRLERGFRDLNAPALEEHDELMARLGAYDLTKAVDAPSSVTPPSSLLRLPSRPTTDAWHDATSGLAAQAADECRRAAGAAQIREWQWQPTCENPHWTLLHLPAYATHYTDDDGRPQPMLINGQTGQFWGRRRGSKARAKVTAAKRLGVAAVVFVLALVVALIGLAAPPLMPLAGLGLVIALALVVSAGNAVWAVTRFAQEESARDGAASTSGNRR